MFYDPSNEAPSRPRRNRPHRRRDQSDSPRFQYQPISEPEELGNGGRVKWVAGRPARRRPTPELISSSPATAASPLSTFFSTSCPEQDSATRRQRMEVGWQSSLTVLNVALAEEGSTNGVK